VEVHDTIIAEIGILRQLSNAPVPACTLRLQIPGFRSKLRQVTETGSLAETVGIKSGLLASKLMVAGVTLRLTTPAAGRVKATAGLPGTVGARGAGAATADTPPAASKAVTNQGFICGYVALMVKVAVAEYVPVA